MPFNSMYFKVSINKTDCHDTTEILVKEALNTITLTLCNKANGSLLCKGTTRITVLRSDCLRWFVWTIFVIMYLTIMTIISG